MPERSQQTSARIFDGSSSGSRRGGQKGSGHGSIDHAGFGAVGASHDSSTPTGPGASKHHQNSTRKLRDRKRMKLWRERKNVRNFWAPTLRGPISFPPFGAPPSGLKCPAPNPPPGGGLGQKTILAKVGHPIRRSWSIKVDQSR